MIKDYLNTYYSPEWVYKEIKQYLALDEVYREDVINYMVGIYGESKAEDMLWSFLEFRNLSNFLYIRKNFPCSYILVNTAKMEQRGVRDNLCKISKNYARKNKLTFSAHARYAAFDYEVYLRKNGITVEVEPEDVRDWIVKNSKKIPYHIRLEWKKSNGKPITWVHQDSNYEPSNPKVYRFNI